MTTAQALAFAGREQYIIKPSIVSFIILFSYKDPAHALRALLFEDFRKIKAKKEHLYVT